MPDGRKLHKTIGGLPEQTRRKLYAGMYLLSAATSDVQSAIWRVPFAQVFSNSRQNLAVDSR